MIQYFVQYGAAERVGHGPRDPAQSTAAFRIPWAVQMVPAWILLVGLFFFPHSPRWLASRDRWDEALQVLADLHGDGDVHHPRALAQYREIEDSLRFSREQAISSFAALFRRRMLRRVILGMSIQAWSQLCGMNIMMCSSSPLASAIFVSLFHTSPFSHRLTTARRARHGRATPGLSLSSSWQTTSFTSWRAPRSGLRC